MSRNPEQMAAGMRIMAELDKMCKQYLDSEGNSLLIGGNASYIYPAKYVEIARGHNFTKYKSFGIYDESLIGEIQHLLENNRMVVVAAWTKEDRVDVYLEPTYSGGSETASTTKRGCFIATAVYGSPLAPEVLVFRLFRDKVLLTSKLGTTFVELYYFISPPLAYLISKTHLLRTATRQLLLDPILRLLKNSSRF